MALGDAGCSLGSYLELPLRYSTLALVMCPGFLKHCFCGDGILRFQVDPELPPLKKGFYLCVYLKVRVTEETQRQSSIC